MKPQQRVVTGRITVQMLMKLCVTVLQQTGMTCELLNEV
jgi:hypothetical protein